MLLRQKHHHETYQLVILKEDVMRINNIQQLIQNHLEGLTSRFQFEFCAVNMIDIENRVNSADHDLFSVLSDAELQHWEGLTLPKNKIQWISGRYAVKSALFKYKSGNGRIMDLSCIDVIKGADSAPYLLQYPGIYVSITHSYPYCIGVVSETKIGIDLEAVFSPPDSLIHYFYTPNEQQQLQNCLDPKAFTIQAMIFWTRKEAVSKLLKLGMKMDFKALDTTEDQIEVSGPLGGKINLVSCICNNFCLSTAVFTPTS